MSSPQTTPLEGKVAIVTGGAGGMGRAYALRLADLGADVVIADLDLAAGKRRGEYDDSVSAEIEALGRRSIGVEGDLAQRSSARAVVTATVETFGRIDILVNNAGGAITPIERSTITASPEDDTRLLFGANFFSTLYLCQEAAPHLTRPGASVINIATLGVHNSSPAATYAIYSAAKAAVVDLTRSLAVELGPDGIRVNAVAPGIILTARVLASAAERGIGGDDQARNVPLRRLGTTDDMAGAIEFFATDLSRYVTGELLTVDGGVHRVSAL